MDLREPVSIEGTREEHKKFRQGREKQVPRCARDDNYWPRKLLGGEERRSRRLAPLGHAKARPYNDWRSMLRRYKGDAGGRSRVTTGRYWSSRTCMDWSIA